MIRWRRRTCERDLVRVIERLERDHATERAELVAAMCRLAGRPLPREAPVAPLAVVREPQASDGSYDV